MSGRVGAVGGSRSMPVRSGGGRATLLGLGSARPARIWDQRELATVQERLWNLDGANRARWRRIVDRSGVDARAIATEPDRLMRLSTPARMELFERLAPPLAREACREGLTRAGIDAARVTDLVVVTCTGLAAPGLGAALVGESDLGLRREVRHLQLAFMGCFGGIAALRTASALARADPGAVVLAVCVELCSLHLRRELDPQNLVASALFADGAASIVVAGADASAETPRVSGVGRCELGMGRSLTLPEHRGEMSWRLTDEGFAMTLSREVPKAIEEEIGGFVESTTPTPRAVLSHPGGPGILDAVERALRHGPLAPGLDPRGMEIARAVLRDCGNMSSATILFVLDRALRAGLASPFQAIAFGPGLTVDAIGLEASTGEGPTIAG